MLTDPLLRGEDDPATSKWVVDASVRYPEVGWRRQAKGRIGSFQWDGRLGVVKPTARFNYEPYPVNSANPRPDNGLLSRVPETRTAPSQ